MTQNDETRRLSKRWVTFGAALLTCGARAGKAGPGSCASPQKSARGGKRIHPEEKEKQKKLFRSKRVRGKCVASGEVSGEVSAEGARCPGRGARGVRGEARAESPGSRQRVILPLLPQVRSSGTAVDSLLSAR
ncbi:hypothetical protein WMY93_032750 [Mugilogobius chulae]|uniref:Secreted protein n=1 Tax=Mugilogobius chulae TaxID=88201 RepID=A0AAW0MVW7_9GOBI